jgi:hypothetical protein
MYLSYADDHISVAVLVESGGEFRSADIPTELSYRMIHAFVCVE